MHSSGIFSFVDRSLRYPKWCAHPNFLVTVVAGSSLTSLLLGSLIFTFVASGFRSSSNIISVKQYGHAL